MLRATWRGLLSRKLRLLLASLSVLLGISFAAGAYVLTDSIGRVFDNLFATINEGTAVTVRGASAFGSSSFEGNDREPVPQAVLDQVSRVDGVGTAIGGVGQLATLVLPNGKVFKTHGPPVLGVSFHKDSPQETLTIVRGAAPSGLHQVLVDARTVDKEHLRIGDVIGVIGNGPQDKATIVGIARFGSTNSLAGATLLGFDPASAQQLFGTPGTWDQLSVSARPGVSDKELRERIAAVLPAKKYEVLTSTQSAAQQSDDIKEGLKFFNTFLQYFARIALFVGGFLIFNTFSMLVAQRTRELALMRALGASRGQVLRSVLTEAVAVGLVGGIGGLGLGVLLAKGFRSLLGALGVEIPKGPTVIETRTVVYSLAAGILVTVVAAAIPARRAGRMAPVQALRESGPAESKSLKVRTLVGATILVLGALSLAGGLGQGEIALVGLGALASFIGVTVISPIFARPVVGLLAAPFARLGVSGRLGRGNAMRNPRRTSTTAAALMIGLALVAAISTLGSSARKSVVAVVATSLGADYVLHTAQYGPFSPAVATELAKQPELADVAAFTQTRANFGKAGTSSVQGVDPAALQQVLKLKVLSGDLSGLQDDQLAVSKAEAERLGVHVGDAVEVTWAKTGQQQLAVGAVYDNNQFAGGYIVTADEFSSHVTDKKVIVVAVKGAASATPQQSRAAIERGLKGFPDVEFEDQAEFVKKQGDQINGVLNVITGLLMLSVLIAVLGIINTLALSIIERTRELGLLRAVGLQRRQLKRMIRVESIVIAVFGALLGLVVGVAFGWALVSALHDEGITEFAIPWTRIVLVLLVAAVGGVLAAALPARRGARLKVLDAIATA
ncbi:MAG: ABC transporter permease, partial [Mycobacteriales bacterium]